MRQRNFALLFVLVAFICVMPGAEAGAQCPVTEFAAGFRAPAKIIFSPKGNLLVAEAGHGPNTGRISIIDPRNGARRTLLDGLPSGFAPPVGHASGPSGLVMRGRTLFVTIGSGDAVRNGATPGSEAPNQNRSSPIFSSVLAVRFSANVEMTTDGFALTLADHFALQNGAAVELNNESSDKLTVRLLADFPDYIPQPRPDEPDNVRPANPFGIAISGETLYVADAAMNMVRAVESETGTHSTLTTFAPIPNTRGFGPPAVEAVPDSIRLFGDHLLVTLLTGFPFPPGAAQVRAVDPATGASVPFITGLSAAIDVLPVAMRGGQSEFLTLEHSADQFLQLPGRLRRYATPASPPVVIADCLAAPTSMARDARTGGLFVTEIFAGRVVRVIVP